MFENPLLNNPPQYNSVYMHVFNFNQWQCNKMLKEAS